MTCLRAHMRLSHGSGNSRPPQGLRKSAPDVRKRETPASGETFDSGSSPLPQETGSGPGWTRLGAGEKREPIPGEVLPGPTQETGHVFVPRVRARGGGAWLGSRSLELRNPGRIWAPLSLGTSSGHCEWHPDLSTGPRQREDLTLSSSACSWSWRRSCGIPCS